MDDVDQAIASVIETVEAAPRAASTLTGLLRLSATLGAQDGLIAESLAYSMLLAGPEFARWRGSRPIRPVPDVADPVVLQRVRTCDGDELQILLNLPERRNAFGSAVREGLLDAFDVVDADLDITRVVLRGAGQSFCSGGDLDEFGMAVDVTTAHLVRPRRTSAPTRL